MRISRTLGVAVVNQSFELEGARHRKLAEFAASKGRPVNEVLRELLVPWIDQLTIATERPQPTKQESIGSSRRRIPASRVTR